MHPASRDWSLVILRICDSRRHPVFSIDRRGCRILSRSPCRQYASYRGIKNKLRAVAPYHEVVIRLLVCGAGTAVRYSCPILLEWATMSHATTLYEVKL